mgnify:CR=1 FL=1
MAGHRRAWRIIPGDPEVRSQVLGEFIRGDYISIGWDIGDIAGMSDDEIRRKLEERREIWGEFSIGHALRLLKTLRDEMKEGDMVIMSVDGFIYAVGEIVSPYYYEPIPPLCFEYRGKSGKYIYPYKRRVRWLRITKLPHSELPEEIRKHLQRPPTIVEIDWDMWERLSHIILSP